MCHGILYCSMNIYMNWSNLASLSSKHNRNVYAKFSQFLLKLLLSKLTTSIQLRLLLKNVFVRWHLNLMIKKNNNPMIGKFSGSSLQENFTIITKEKNVPHLMWFWLKFKYIFLEGVSNFITNLSKATLHTRPFKLPF